MFSELEQLKERLEKLSQVFNMTYDETEIESIIYEEKAVMLRYSLALKKAKELGMTAFAERRTDDRNSGISDFCAYCD